MISTKNVQQSEEDVSHNMRQLSIQQQLCKQQHSNTKIITL